MTKFKLQAAPVNPSFRGNHQAFLDMVADGLVIYTDAVGFSPSETQPVGNDGPWVNDNNELMVWDETLSTYVPLDLSESYVQPFWIGATAPTDTEEFQLWVKVSSTAVLGIYWWNGSEWVTQFNGIPDGSVTTVYIADLAVTTRKIRDGAVTPEQISGNIGLSKWAIGGNGYFVRSKADGSAPEWRKVQHVSEDYPKPSSGNFVQHIHPLGTVPHEVKVTAYHYTEANADDLLIGIEIEDEYDFDALFPFTVITEDEISVAVGAFYLFIGPDGKGYTPTDAHWRFRIRYTAP